MLNPDFRDMLSCLNEAEAEYLVVGAYALAAHGYPRATGDIDIWIRRSDVNAEKIMRALSSFGAPLSDLTRSDFTKPHTVVQLGIEPSRIDIITAIDGLEFDEGWITKVPVIVDGIEVFVPSKINLLRNKIAANRDKDQSDIAWLRKQTSTD
jgi:hypothetical protein